MCSLVFWLLMCLGGSKTCVFIGVLARREHWGFQNPMFFKGLLAPRRPWGLHCFHRFFCFLNCLQNPFVFRGVLAPKSFVFFIGCWILGGSGNSKNLCFHKFSGSSGGLGGCKPCLFTSILAPRGPWAPKPYVQDVLAPRVLWGLPNLVFHKCSGSSGDVGNSKT